MENISSVGRNESETDNFANTGIISRPETIVVVNCVLNAPLMLLSIFGNALVLVTVLRIPIISSPSMITLCSLAVSDLLVSFIAQPLYIAKELTKDPLLSSVWDTVGYSVCGVSLLIITAINVDRFMALHYHLRYVTLVTKSRVKYTVTMIWLMNFLLSGFYFWNDLAYHFVLAVIIGICLVISTFAYIRIYQIVRLHHLQIRAQHQAVEHLDVGNNMRIKRLRKSAMNTFVFYMCMIACYFPMYTLLSLHGVNSSHKVWRKEWNFATTAVFMNSSINPFLYYWRLRDLRTAVDKTAKMILCREAHGT